MTKTVSVGYFGIPGGKAGGKTHFVSQGIPICGTPLHKKSQFQFCGYSNTLIPECVRCLKKRTHK